MKTTQTDKATARPLLTGTLSWLVVNPDGKLLAALDSESEAYWFTQNRGHADGAVYFKAETDYVKAVNEHAALVAVADEAAKQDGTHYRAGQLRLALANLAAVRGEKAVQS